MEYRAPTRKLHMQDQQRAHEPPDLAIAVMGGSTLKSSQDPIVGLNAI